MKKLTVIIAVIFTVIALTGCFEPPYTPPTGADANVAVYVLNSAATSISVIDLEEDSVYNNVATVGMWPNQLVYRDAKLYCVNSGSNNIMIWDVATWTPETPIDLGADNNPMNMVFYGDDVAYVACSGSGAVLKVNMTTKTVVQTMPAGVGCTGIAIANDQVYTANTGYNGWGNPYLAGTVSVFDAVSGDSVTTIDVSTNPQSIDTDAMGKLHVMCTGDYGTSSWGTIKVIDPATDAVTATYPLGFAAPGSISIDKVGNVGYGGVWGAGAVAYNTTNGTVTNAAFAGHGGSGLMYFDGVWISDWDADKVYKYNSTGTAIDSFAVGDSPAALAFRNDPQD
ncbi:MAG: hypothetical protein KAH15_01265 [Candidatus Marinimicrobia bacterium]|nr:hypothetical protein [Candidatus Neomarinimicrobiota bacterium]